MASEITKTPESTLAIRLDTSNNQPDIGRRIDVNKPSVETSKDGIDIGKRVQPDVNPEQSQLDKKDLEPQHKTVDGHEQYYDDNGKRFRIDNDLLPNTEYEINGYKYMTDDKGRIISASGQLHLKENGRKHLDNRRDDMDTIGKGDQKASDDKGHLIGDQFDGTNGLENMVPQDFSINRGDYSSFECELAKEVGDGKTVTVDVQPIYSNDSRRPDAIAVTYSIDGEVNTSIFPNSGQEETR